MRTRSLASGRTAVDSSRPARTPPPHAQVHKTNQTTTTAATGTTAVHPSRRRYLLPIVPPAARRPLCLNLPGRVLVSEPAAGRRAPVPAGPTSRAPLAASETPTLTRAPPLAAAGGLPDGARKWTTTTTATKTNRRPRQSLSTFDVIHQSRSWPSQESQVSARLSRPAAWWRGLLIAQKWHQRHVCVCVCVWSEPRPCRCGRRATRLFRDELLARRLLAAAVFSRTPPPPAAHQSCRPIISIERRQLAAAVGPARREGGSTRSSSSCSAGRPAASGGSLLARVIVVVVAAAARPRLHQEHWTTSSSWLISKRAERSAGMSRE
jgi:hypothetical protein